MSHFFGYTDLNNNMYVTAGSDAVDYVHAFPQKTWTKISNVKYPVISNEDYNSAVDGYIDTSNNLYIWRSNKTPVLVDTNVKQADSSEEGTLFYVKADNTLWSAYVKTTISKQQVASNVEYVVSANRAVAYRSLDGIGYFGAKSSDSVISVSFASVGKVKSVAVTGGNGSYRKYMYITDNNDLFTTVLNYNTLPVRPADFTKVALNVKSVKKGGWEYCYLTLDNTLYWVYQNNGHQKIATNVSDYWTNKTWGSNLEAIFYTTLDQPNNLKAAEVAGANVSNILGSATNVNIMGSYYGAGFINEPPSQPGVITGVQSNDLYLTGEKINLSWGSSIDPEDDKLTYTLEFYNGSSWIVLEEGLTSTSYTYELPSLNAASVRFRVKAIDENKAESTYRASDIFTVRKHLTLIQDGEKLKTYKNGDWKTI